MHPRMQELFAYLNVRRTALREAVDAVPEAQRNERPAAGRWSVAEVLEHLALVEARFKSMIGDRLAEAKAAGLAAETETSAIAGTYEPTPMLDRSEKHQAPDVVVPKAAEWQTAWTKLEAVRRTFLDVYCAGDGFALGAVEMHHPRLGTMNLYQWGLWLGAHEARHTEQVREIAATSDPASTSTSSSGRP
ncbi:MAG: DinB family protein [Acidobacteria bacterium]|nr:DinB family protein [Acidobacteriota bacterium]